MNVGHEGFQSRGETVRIRAMQRANRQQAEAERERGKNIHAKEIEASQKLADAAKVRNQPSDSAPLPANSYGIGVERNNDCVSPAHRYHIISWTRNLAAKVRWLLEEKRGRGRAGA